MVRQPFAHRRPVEHLLEGVAVLTLVGLAALVSALILTRPATSEDRRSLLAGGETVRARVTEVVNTWTTTDDSGLVIVDQTLRLTILSAGPSRGLEVVVAFHGMGATQRIAGFRAGQQALVMISQAPDGNELYQVADHFRLTPLALLALTFITVTILVGRGQGLRALLGLLLSVLLIGGFVIPQILAQRDAIIVALAGAALLVAGTTYLIQGWTVIAHTALIGLMGSLGVAGLLAGFWTWSAHLSGFGSEETLYLQAIGAGLQMRGLLLAGMVTGVAGVLDDVVLAQSVAVFELASANTTLRRRDLYRSGMRVGVTHLASMVNTLVLAYASTALPLILLFYLYPEPWHLTINREMIAQEIIRALVGSLGLMLAVPLTTAIASAVAAQPSPMASSSGEEDRSDRI